MKELKGITMATDTLNRAEYLLSLVQRNNHQKSRKEILQEDGTLKGGVSDLIHIIPTTIEMG